MDLFLIWIYHVVLISLLIVVVGTTMHGDAVSRGVYRFGTFVGLLGAALGPWPWPYTVSPWAAPTPLTYFVRVPGFFTDLVLIPCASQPWPVWQPPATFLRNAAPVFGVLTALAGGLLGLALILIPMRLLRSGSKPRVPENALFLMMIGTFTGWQAVVLIVAVALILKWVQAVLALLWRGRAGRRFACG